MLIVYCSGSIPKTGEIQGLIWSDVERNDVRNGAAPIELDFLNPNDPVDNLNDALVLFGRDIYHVSSADVVVIDARDRCGIGVGVELLASRFLETPAVVVAPDNSYYRRDLLEYRRGLAHNYIHPHVFALADVIVDDFVQAGEWIRDSLSLTRPKSLDVLQNSIGAYVQRMLDGDTPTQRALHHRRGRP